jgi:hypothetical protein
MIAADKAWLDNFQETVPAKFYRYSLNVSGTSLSFLEKDNENMDGENTKTFTLTPANVDALHRIKINK